MDLSSLSKDKLLAYILICMGCFTISFNVAAVSAAVPVIAQDLGLNDFLVAKIIPYYLLPYGFGALLYAPLTRYVSFRWSYVGVMLLYGISCLIAGTARDLNALLIGRVVMGITAASAIPLGLMLIGDFFESSIRGRLVGIFFSHAFVASIAGLLVAGTLPWTWIFYIPAFLGLVLSVIFLCYNNSCFSHKHVGHIDYFKVLRKKEIAKVFSFIFVISFLYHGVHKWYGVYLDQVYGFDKLTISFFFILTVVAGMLGQISGGILSDKKGRLITIQIGVGALAISICLLSGIYSKVILGCVLFLISVFWTVGHNGISTVLTDFSPEDRPVIASLNSSVRFISGGLGFMVSRHFVENNFGQTFLMFGLLTLVLFSCINKVIPAQAGIK